MHRRPLTRRLGLLVAATLVLAACSDNTPQSDAGAFCAQAQANTELILNPPLSTSEEVQQSIDFYRLMGQLAPLDIAEEWDTLVHAMQTASGLIPGDQASEQLVAKTAYATERAAYEVSRWMSTYCHVELPITTIVPHDSTAGPIPTWAPGQTPTLPPATVPATVEIAPSTTRPGPIGTRPENTTPDDTRPLGTEPVAVPTTTTTTITTTNGLATSTTRVP